MKPKVLGAMNPVVASDKLKRTEVWAEDDESVHWAGALLSMAAMAPPPLPRSFMRSSRKRSAGIPMPPRRRSTLSPEPGNYTWKMAAPTASVRGDVFAIPTPVKHDLVNVGKENIARRRVFRRSDVHPKLRQRDDAAEKPHALGTPNREG